MQKPIILIVLLMSITIGLFAQATNLLISEYVEGSSYNKAIEIFNGTGVPVNLATVSIKKQTNGAGAFGNELVLSGTLANNDVFVIVSSNSGGTNLAGQPYVDLATTSQAINFNGNDAVALFRNGVMIDVVGIVDQVDYWGENMTLVRNSNVASPSTTFNPDEWTQYPQNTFTYLGYHNFTGGSTEPSIIVTYPNTAVSWYYGQTYTITWSSSNVEGDVSIGLLNGENLIPITEATANDGSYDYTVENTLPGGNQYRVIIAAVNGSAADTSDTYFSIGELPITEVSNLSQLRASNPDGTTVYRVSNPVILTYKQTYRNKKYFQDTTGAIEVDDLAGIITTPLEIGDAIINLTGTLSSYHNLLQFTPFINIPAPVSSGNAITPEVLTINALTTNFENYESALVQLNNVTFLDTSTPFAAGVNYNISDPTGQIIFRTNFYEADYLGQAIPTGAISMKVITTQYDNTYEVTARYLSDFSTVASEDYTFAVESIAISNFPNPFRNSTTISFTTKSAQPATVEIYNLKGRLVAHLSCPNAKAGVNTLNWNGKDDNGNPLSAGVYLYKYQSGSNHALNKMVLMK
ncbi:MAG: lamin tail domain-containing protein [Candidatus Cloacimonadaceae bacterium]